MPAESHAARSTDWDGLLALAFDQAGLFASSQAREHGIGTALLAHHRAIGRIEPMRRGVWRFAVFPSHPREEFVAIWLWSKREGVFTHETALYLHELSDAFPTQFHLTLPRAWARRRLTPPPHTLLAFDDIPDEDITLCGPVPVTTPRRTILDGLRDAVSHEFIRDAISQARGRGFLSALDVRAMHAIMVAQATRGPIVSHRRRFQARP